MFSPASAVNCLPLGCHVILADILETTFMLNMNPLKSVATGEDFDRGWQTSFMGTSKNALINIFAAICVLCSNQCD